MGLAVEHEMFCDYQHNYLQSHQSLDLELLLSACDDHPKSVRLTVLNPSVDRGDVSGHCCLVEHFDTDCLTSEGFDRRRFQ
jgi:hypothetical protein